MMINRLCRLSTRVFVPAVVALLCAACSNKLDGPTPVLSAKKPALPVEPGIVCGDQLTTELTLSGLGFSPVPVNVPKHPVIAIPSVSLIHGHALDGAGADDAVIRYGGDPTAPSNTSLMSWDSQKQMRITVNQSLSHDGKGGDKGKLESGVYDVRVQNPNTKQDVAVGALAVVDKPAIEGVTPPLVCVAQSDRELVFAGSSFVKIGDALPQVEIESATDKFDISSLDDCTAIAQHGIDAEYCATARLTLKKGSVEAGLHAVTLTNPETAACHSEEQIQLRVVPAPEISAVAPEVLCNLDNTQRVTIQGQGFLEIDGTQPTVKLAGAVTPIAELSGCEDLETTGLTVRSCTGILLDVDVMAFPVGDIAIGVENPQPAGCSGSATGVLRIAGPPTISSIAPTDLCSDVATSFTVMGTGFDRGAQALVDTTAAMVEFVSDTELHVMVDGLSPGVHAFTVRNAGSCEVTQPAALTVDPSPIVFFVDPPAMYGDIPVEVTIFTSGLSASATKVELVRGDERHTLTFTNPSAPNKILAQVPAGLTAGAWDVVVTNVGGCPGTLSGGLTVTTTLVDALVSSIKPSYGSATEATAVTISGAGLLAVPRVYLSASGSTGSARALRAVQVKPDGTALTAVIPAGLSPASYDLIVVNPDGKVDVLANAVTITTDPPPVITAVTPASLPSNASNVPITIAGTGFKSNLTVELDCLTTNDSRTIIPTTEQSPSGGGTTVVVNVTMANAAPSAVDAGSVCLVRLKNQDGAFFEYSAFSVTNSSLNLSPWQTAPDLGTARRALSLVAGRPTSTSRYLYAIGGDDGVASAPTSRGATTFDSVESSSVDVFGALGAWSAQRNRLPAARTAAGAATIGRFVYLVGGHDGTTATDTLMRASILDPLAGPEISDLDATLGDGSKGLGGGLYYYQVAAVMVANDAANPGGETLAGELLPVQLPDRSEKIGLLLKWNAVAGAHGYRVYRSPAANAAADTLRLLGEISCGATPDTACDCIADPTRCRLLDEAGATDANKSPMPSGSLGVWHAVSGARCTTADCSLASAREGLAVTTLEDPTTPGRFYLYAFGGRNAAGTYLDTYEVATVTVAANGSQTVADFAAGGDTLEIPRADHGVWVMSKRNANVIAGSGTPNDVWVYVGGGRTTGNATSLTLEAGKLGANGILNAFVSTDPLKGNLVGFGTGASNDQLYTFGGTSTADGTSASLCDGTGSCAALPDLKSGAFNALGSATTQRMFAGATQESAFFFVAGGHDGTNTIKSTQTTVQ
jgi:hypothetical protein